MYLFIICHFSALMYYSTNELVTNIDINVAFVKPHHVSFECGSHDVMYMLWYNLTLKCSNLSNQHFNVWPIKIKLYYTNDDKTPGIFYDTRNLSANFWGDLNTVPIPFSGYFYIFNIYFIYFYNF